MTSRRQVTPVAVTCFLSQLFVIINLQYVGLDFIVVHLKTSRGFKHNRTTDTYIALYYTLYTVQGLE